MFDVGFFELVVIIIISVFLLDKKDYYVIVKKVRSIFRYIADLKNKFIDRIDSFEHEVHNNKTDEELTKDFESFSKEYLEPKKSKKEKKDE